jgi:hypothetical protein
MAVRCARTDSGQVATPPARKLTSWKGHVRFRSKADSYWGVKRTYRTFEGALTLKDSA